MKHLLDQLNDAIKKAFENGNYEIVELGVASAIEIKFHGLKDRFTVLKFQDHCILFLIQSRCEYFLLPFDILVEKLVAFEVENKSKQIKDLEAKLQELKER